MRSVPSLLSMLDDPKAQPAILTPAVLPWDYVRMRREAAGLSIADAARPYWHRPEHRADVERNLQTLETVGFRVQRHFFVLDMSRSYPLNIAVYRQLCDDRAEQHPRLCLGCGWDEWTDQLDCHDHDVTWSTSAPERCTLCEQERRPVFRPRPANHHPDNTPHGTRRIAA